ncbi:MAG: CoB--CoM heterodisulfide reductase iron-sulfur subunit A family protein [Euryarchaeota archaeon]|nr:CoB--CoM heterodisulfide reductase iron-sulfur subunit A family protein [Euryarchaeota archaeon]
MTKNYVGAVLIIGGGVSGIQASLDLAESGLKVYLVEKNPSIGGGMAQLDKTFPTNDCSMCILAPKMVEVARHPNIELITYAEVKEVKGHVGNFRIKIQKNPRYVDEKTCNGCGLCAEKCPVLIPNEFDSNIGAQKVIGLPFPQAVPAVYTIYKDFCIECRSCEFVCDKKAINFQQEPQEIQINVGAIIVSTGHAVFDAAKKSVYKFGIYKNVITSLEFERLLSASGPTQGHVIKFSDGQEPKNIAFIQCVGSRDEKIGNPYCSRVCCMYATKEAIIAKEHNRNLEITIFFMDLRAYGKAFQEYVQRARDEYGINYIRARVSDIQEDTKTNNLIIKYIDTVTSEYKKFEADMVVLSCGLVKQNNAEKLAQILNTELDENGFFKEKDLKTAPMDTAIPGIYICGTAQGPKDIPDSVAQGSGAAARAVIPIAEARGTLIKEKIFPLEKLVTIEEEPRIGVFVCHCGTNIAGVVNIPEVVNHAKSLPNVVYATNTVYACADDAQTQIKKAINDYNLNRVVVASCTPRTHEVLFRGTLKEGGLNPYLFEMANIREHSSWVHTHEPQEATERAKDQLRMAAAKARLLRPQEEKEIPVIPSALVIGAGISGMMAALNIADQGFKVYLVDKKSEPGGLLKEIYKVFPTNGYSKDVLEPIIKKVKEHNNIELLTSSTVKEVVGYIGNFDVKISREDQDILVKVGTIVVATGSQEFKPNGMFGYGKHPNVMTQLELEQKLANHELKNPKNIVMIQCVGAREENGRTYCSRVCCAVALKNAQTIKEMYPNCDVSICYRDIQSFGKKHEEYYEKTQEIGVNFLKYEPEKPPSVNDGKVLVFDNVLRREIELDADYIILSTPLVPTEDAETLSKTLKVPRSPDGFFAEAHAKLRPVEFMSDGIYLCGCAQGPKDITDSVSQACGAASRAIVPMAKGKIKLEALTTFVDIDVCIGCGQCVKICSFNAIKLKEIKPGISKADVEEVICKGCGGCVPTCPTGALSQKGFETIQIRSMVKAFLEE